MLIVKSYGGLGNQMFQYAFYEFLKKDNLENVFLDINDFKIHHHHHGFELMKVFDLEIDIASEKQIKNISYNQNGLIYRFFKKYLKIILSKPTEYYEGLHTMLLQSSKINKDCYFIGFWQNEYYVNSIRDRLIEKFDFKKEFNNKNKALLEEIKNYDSVSIHVRRGDYVNNSSLGGICTVEYYSKAIKLMQENYKNAKFVVFSDDINWVKENLELPSDSIYVDWNTEEESYLDMILMSRCNHNIIANSTFSWWGAWLNQNINKTVVMPLLWYNSQTYNPLCCKGWICL